MLSSCSPAGPRDGVLEKLGFGEEGPGNVVLVSIDTLRADHVGVYGGSVPTPHLDALAERGYLFEEGA